MAYPFGGGIPTAPVFGRGRRHAKWRAGPRHVGRRLSAAGSATVGRAAQSIKSAPSAHEKIRFEELEPRLLLSADLMPGAESALVSGLQDLEDLTDRLAALDGMTRPLPIINRSIGEELDGANFVLQKLVNPVMQYFADESTGDNTPTGEELQAVLDALPEIQGPVTLFHDPGQIRFDLSFEASTQSSAPLDLGPDLAAEGFSIDAPPSVPIETSLGFDISIGLDLTDGALDDGDFFLIGEFITFGALVDDAALDFPIGFGMLEPQVAGGSARLDATVVARLAELDGDTDGRLTAAELAGTPTDVTAAGEASANLPLKAGFLGFSAGGNPAITVSDLDVFDGIAPDVVRNDDFSAISDRDEEAKRALVEASAQLASLADDLDEAGLIGTDIFLIGGTIGDFLDLGSILDAHFAQPVFDLFDQAIGVADLDDILDEFNAQSGTFDDLTFTSTASGALVGDVVKLDLGLSGQRLITATELSLGDDIEDLLTVDGLTADLTTAFAWTFGLDIDLATLPASGDAAAYRFDTPLAVTADVSDPAAVFQAQAGFLGLDIGTVNGIPSTIALDADIDVAIAAGGATVSEIQATPVDALATQTGTGRVDITLRALASNGITGIADDPLAPATISFGDDLFDAATAAVFTNNFDALGITDFQNADGESVRTLFGQFRDFLDGFSTTNIFDTPVPLTSSSTLGGVFDLSGVFTQQVNDRIETPPATDDDTASANFATAQQLIGSLTGLIANLAYNPLTQYLTFDLTINENLAPVDDTIGLFDTGPLTELSSDSLVTLLPTAALAFGFGLVLTPIGSNLAPLSANTLLRDLNRGRGMRTQAGVADIEIALKDGTVFQVDLDNDLSTATLGEVIAQIEASALAAAGLGAVDVGFNDIDTGLKLTDRTIGVQPFEIRAVNGSFAGFDLGIIDEGLDIDETGGAELVIEGSSLHGDTQSHHFGLLSGSLDLGVGLSAPDIQASGLWGGLAVDVQGGAASGTSRTVIDLVEPVTEGADGLATIPEIQSALGNEDDLVGTRTDTGSLVLDLTVAPGPGFADVVDVAPVLHAEVADVTDIATLTFALQADPGNQVADLLSATENLTVADLDAALAAAADYLIHLQGEGLIGTAPAGLDQSLGQLLGFGTELQLHQEQAAQNQEQTLQERLEAWGQQPGLTVTAALVTGPLGGADTLRFDFGLDLPQRDKQLPLTLNLTTLGVDLATLGLDVVGTVADSNVTTPLDVSAGGRVDLDLGIDLSDSANPVAFLFDTTSASFDLRATQQALNFEALFGSVAGNIVNGSYNLDADGSGDGVTDLTDPAAYTVTLASGRHLFGDALGATTVDLAGALDIELPIVFPAPISAPQPDDLVLAIADLGDAAATTSLTGPHVADLLAALTLDDVLASFDMGFDQLFGELEQVLNTQVFGPALPLVGGELAEAADLIGQIRTSVSGNLALLEQAMLDLTPTNIRQALFDALGPGGLDWLQESSGDASLTPDDIGLINTGSEVLYDLILSQLLSFDLDLDLALPGLGLEFEPGTLTEVEFDFSFPLKLGMSVADGVFIETSLPDELVVQLEASSSGLLAPTSATLGFMPYTVTDDAATPSQLSGTYRLDLMDAGGNGRLSLGEVKSLAPADLIDGGFDGSADVNLHLVTAITAGAAFPTYRMDLNGDWTFLDTGDPAQIAQTTPAVLLNDVEVDLIRLLDDFLLPQLIRMDQAFAPADPVISVLGSEVPGISLLFPGFDWFDLIQFFGSGVNETQAFIDAFNTIKELIVEIPKLDGDLWINLGSFALDGNVAQTPTDTLVAREDLVLPAPDSTPRAFIPTPDPGNPEPTAEEFRQLLREQPDTILGQIFAPLADLDDGLLEDLESVNDTASEIRFISDPITGFPVARTVNLTLTTADQKAAFLFLQTQSLSDNDDAFVDFTDLLPVGGIIGGEPSNPMRFFILENPLNSLGLLLGDPDPIMLTAPSLVADPGVDAEGAPLAGNLLFEYQTPDFEFFFYEIIPASLVDLIAKKVPGITKFFSPRDDDGSDSDSESDSESDSKKKKKVKTKTEYGITIAFEMDVDFGFAFDTEGLKDFASTGDASNILQGFFIDDLDGIGNITSGFADGSAASSLKTEPVSFFGGNPDEVNIQILGGVGFKAEFSAAVGPLELSLGAALNILIGATYNTNDPNEDGKVRAAEFDLNRTVSDINAFNTGGRILARLDFSAGLSLNLFVPIDIVDVNFNVFTLPILDVEFGNTRVAPPVLALPPQSPLTLNMGPNAGLRGAGETDGDETFLIGPGANPGEVVITAFGATQTLAGVTEVIAFGGEGNDTLIVADDLLLPVEFHGGPGNDRFVGGGGRATVFGDEGDDSLQGGRANDEIFGGAGDDTIFGGPGNDVLHGDAGLDTLSGDEGDDILRGDDDADVLFGGRGGDQLFGGAGADDLFGEAGSDVIHGDAGADVIEGGGGADTVFGGLGIDSIDGGDGPDELHGDEGADRVVGGFGNDLIFGGIDNDILGGGPNNDIIFGDDGEDTIRGQGASDELYGGAGADTIFADDDAAGGILETVETIFGGAGNDTIYGDNFADTVFGEAGDDTIFGLGGDDILDGGQDNDTIFGGAGDDWLVGGFGDDELSGGTGSDVLWGGFAEGTTAPSDFDGTNSDNFTLPPSFAGNDGVEARFPTGYMPPEITPAVLLGQNAEGRIGDGRDILRGDEETDFLFGGDESDTLLGGAGADYLDAGAGDDVNVHGGLDDDVVRGGSGRDALHGDSGIDQIYGDGGDDNLFGDAGLTMVQAMALGSVAMTGSQKGQRLFGGSGRDSLFAFAPSDDPLAEGLLVGDQLFGGSGGDFLFGNLRQEILLGEGGNDFISGDALAGPRYLDNTLADLDGADDELRGGSGEDQLLGGGGADVIWGGADTDWIEGQNGPDTLYGGAGIDILVLDTGPTPDQVDPTTGVRLFDRLGDEIHGHFGNELEGDVFDDNATDILLIEGSQLDDTIRLRQSDFGEGILDQAGNPILDEFNAPVLALGDQLLVEYNDARLEAVWFDDQGVARVEQLRVSGLLGDDTIEIVDAGPRALDLSSLIGRSRDFVAVFDGGPGDDLLRGSVGRDRLDGGSGSDTLFGLGGDDRLYGDGGSGFSEDHDVLYAGQGNDDLLGGQGSNELYAWSIDPQPSPDDPFGVFVDPLTGALENDNGDADGDGFLDDVVDGAGNPVPARQLEDTGLNRMLGSSGDDQLYGGTGLDFLFGNGGSDQLFRADGSSFESLDGGLAGDEWKDYARQTNRVWYVGATNADDVITLDFVTEPGLLQDHHLLTRLTNNNGNFSFAAQVRLDFSATDDDGNQIWDPSDVLLDLEALRTDDLLDRNEALARLETTEQQLVNGLLPPEGDFLAIIIDALGGDDQITIGPTVQKTVWVDGGAGDDTIEILAGNAILVDRSEFVTRNDQAADAFVLGGPASVQADEAAPADGMLTGSARFTIALGGGAPVAVELLVGETLDNDSAADLVADLNRALDAAGLGDRVSAALNGALIVLTTTDVGSDASLTLTPEAGNSGAAQLGFPDPVSGDGGTLAASVTYQGLTLDSPDDVDFYRFSFPDDVTVPTGARLAVDSISPNDGIRLELFKASDLTLLTSGDAGGLALDDDSVVGSEFVLKVSGNRIPTIYDLTFDLADGAVTGGVAETVLKLSAQPNDPQSVFQSRRDVLLGGTGNDVLFGGPGEDWIFGQAGNDVLSGGFDRQASDLMFGQEGDDIFQIVPDGLPFLTGSEQTFIPTFNDEMDGGEGQDQVLFLGGDLDDLGRPVDDFAAIRYNRFLQRYEFTALVWDTANQQFVERFEDVPALITAVRDAPDTGRLSQDVVFTLTLDDGRDVAPGTAPAEVELKVTLFAADTDGTNGGVANDSIDDLVDDLRAAISQALVDAGDARPLAEVLRVERDDFRLRIVREATGPGALIEIQPGTLIDFDFDEIPDADELGFAAQRSSGAEPVLEQQFLFYQTDNIEKTVIDTRSGNDVVHGDPEFKFPNVDSEWGIDLGDFEQRGTISALEIRGGPGADRLFGGPLDDVIDGGEGADVIFGGSGNDQITGGGGDDLLFGNTGISPDDLEIVNRGGQTSTNDTFDFAASLPAIVPGALATATAFENLVLSFHLGDAEDWYLIETPPALQGFGAAEVSALFADMIAVKQLVDVNGQLQTNDLLPPIAFQLFAAEDTDTGPGLEIAPVQEFAGVPEFYLLQVLNEDPGTDRHYRLEFGSTLGQTIDVAAGDADLDLSSATIGDRSVAIPLGDLDGDGLNEFIASVRDSLGTVFDLFNAPDGVHPASIIAPSQAEIRFSGSGETVALSLPAPVLEASRFGSRAVFSSPGDLNGDGRDDIVVSVSLETDTGADGIYLDEGVYVLFGREIWPDSIDLIASADAVLRGFGDGLPLNAAVAGDIDGDAFDDLLVSVGGEQPRVEVFRGRAEWTDFTAVLESDFEPAEGLGPTTDGDLLFNDSVAVLPNAVFDGQTDVTVEFWYRSDDQAPTTGLIASASPSQSDLFTLHFDGDGGENFRVLDAGRPFDFLNFNGSTPSADGEWHHFSVVRDQTNGQLSLYFDGALVEVQTGIVFSPITVDDVTPGLVVLGQKLGPSFTNSDPLVGRLDDLRVWDTVRTETEITSNRGAALVGDEPGLHAYYRFNEAGGATIVDETPNELNGALGGNGKPAPLRVDADGFARGTLPDSVGGWALTEDRGADAGHSAPSSLRFAPEGTGIPGGFVDSIDALDLTGSSQARLSFNYFLGTGGRAATDTARVLLTDATGAEVVVLASSRAGEAGVVLLDGADTWQSVEIDLSDFLGRNDLTLQFVYESTAEASSGEFDGWFLDDVSVAKTPVLQADDIIALRPNQAAAF